MRGMARIKNLYQGVPAWFRHFTKVLILVVMFLLFFSPAQTYAEDTNNANPNGNNSPKVYTDSEYKSIKMHPPRDADINLPERNDKGKTDSIQEFYKTQEDILVDYNDAESSDPAFADLDQYFNSLKMELLTKSSGFMKTFIKQYLILEKFVYQDVVPIIVKMELPDVEKPGNEKGSGDKTAVIPKTEADGTVKLKTSNDKPIIEPVNCNSMEASLKEVYTVFCAVQKQDKWITRKQTLF